MAISHRRHESRRDYESRRDNDESGRFTGDRNQGRTRYDRDYEESSGDQSREAWGGGEMRDERSIQSDRYRDNRSGYAGQRNQQDWQNESDSRDDMQRRDWDRNQRSVNRRGGGREFDRNDEDRGMRSGGVDYGHYNRDDRNDRYDRNRDFDDNRSMNRNANEYGSNFERDFDNDRNMNRGRSNDSGDFGRNRDYDHDDQRFASRGHSDYEREYGRDRDRDYDYDDNRSGRYGRR